MPNPGPPPCFKPKKSVALSGTPAGKPRCAPSAAPATTCTIAATTSLDLAAHCEFEEIAHLLVHGKLPTAPNSPLQGEPALAARPARARQAALEMLPPSAHPMDVMRTGVSVLGSVCPKPHDHNAAGRTRHRRHADGLARLDAALLASLRPQRHAASKSKPTTTPSAAHFLHLLHGRRARRTWVAAMHTSLILYAEHEFNASTFTAPRHRRHRLRHVLRITGAIGALQRPEARRRQRGRVRNPAALRDRPTKPKPTSAAASRTGKSSSASAIRSTPSPTRATRSSRKSRGPSPRQPAT